MEGGILRSEKLTVVCIVLEVLAPVEEDEITPETAAALERARASLARGEGIPHEEILREFGFIK